MCAARLGVVADNKDPECKGRIRIQCDMISPGSVTPWVHIAHKHKGVWRLPDIDNMLCQPVCNDEDLTTSR